MFTFVNKMSRQFASKTASIKFKK